MKAPSYPLLLSSAILCFLTACDSVGVRGGDYRLYETDQGREVELDDMVADLAKADVIFLGEEHNNSAGHRLQLWTVKALAAERSPLVITLEQFEADVQESLNAYLAGELSEEDFLARSRPWGNYREHYRPIIEFAKRKGLRVIAANIPRPLASRVAKEGGLYAVGHEPLAPWEVWIDEPEYAQRFARAMGRNHMSDNDLGLQRWFAAQCIKDEKMAESIAQVFESAPEGQSPLVVHLCGKFHSDFGLGTVSRLQRRLPEIEARIITMNSGDELRRAFEREELEAGDFLWRVEEED